MKTAEQWANRIQNSKEPWAKLVGEIQSDAAKAALTLAAEIVRDTPTLELDRDVVTSTLSLEILKKRDNLKLEQL